MDDIFVYCKILKEHFVHLRQVLRRLRRQGLMLKLSKRQFLKEETKYLGFVTNGDGLKPDLDKVEVIRGMPEPKHGEAGIYKEP